MFVNVWFEVSMQYVFRCWSEFWHHAILCPIVSAGVQYSEDINQLEVISVTCGVVGGDGGVAILYQELWEKWPPSGLLQTGNSTVMSGPRMRKWVVSESQQETGKAKHLQFLCKTFSLPE